MPDFTIPAGVLATPPTKLPGGSAKSGKAKKKATKAAKKATKAQQKSIADLLDLGNSRRKIAKTGKRGLRPKGADWDFDSMSGLCRRSKFMMDFILVSMSTESLARAELPKNAKRITFANARQSTIDAIRKANSWTKDRFASKAKNLLNRVAEIANQSNVHPLDVAHTMVNAAGNQAAAQGSRMVDVYRGITPSAIPLSDNVRLMRSIRHSASRHAKGGSALFNAAAQMIRSLGTSLFEGIVTVTGCRPWRRESGAVIGVEIVEFEYAIPTIGPDGEVANWSRARGHHRTAARQAELVARNTEELKGLLQRTPAGRLWLAWNPKKSGAFLATDHAPKRKLFLSWERSKNDAALLRESPSKYLAGFVI